MQWRKSKGCNYEGNRGPDLSFRDKVVIGMSREK